METHKVAQMGGRARTQDAHVHFKNTQMHTATKTIWKKSVDGLS